MPTIEFEDGDTDVERTDEWSVVQEWFCVKPAEPAPDELIWAEYRQPPYEGSADVWYKRGDKLFYVSGGHCSCYGLEDQWEPEEYTPETLGKILAERDWFGPELAAKLAAYAHQPSAPATPPASS